MAFKLADDLPTDAQFAAAMKRASKTTAKKALKRAQELAPVQTGQLRDSGEVNDVQNPQLGEAETSVDFIAPYASHVEEGHFNVRSGRFVAGQHFLANGLKQSEDDLEDETDLELRKLGCAHVRRF